MSAIRLLWGLFIAIVVILPARAQDVMTMIRADRWPEAQAAAAGYADPVVGRLVTYYRMLAPGAATTAEIAAFMAASPDWPLQATLARRRDEALALEPDDNVLLAECGNATSSAAMLHCADAGGRAGHADVAAAMTRRAWITAPADAVAESRFLAGHGAGLSGADQWQRFDRLAWTDTMGATRQEARLDPADRPRAEARLALRRDDPGAGALVGALPAPIRGEPGLMLEQARWLRRANQDASALALWTASGNNAERAAPAERRGAFWDERNILIRRLLRAGDDAGATRLAAGHAQTAGEPLIDAEFLAGFLALRRMSDPAAARPHFVALAAASQAAITQGRAHYWLGRTAEAQGDAAGAAREYAAAASWPDTFYGQLGALRGGDGPARLSARILAAGDPPATSREALDLAGRELARAATYLVGWGESRRAMAFLLRLEDVAPSPADRALAARLATGLGLPETAIGMARLAGRDGTMLIASGWPDPVQIPADFADPALALGIIRQESSFDTSTTSPVGARGLMQLMPGTAQQVAHQLGIPVSVGGLTQDAALNIRLGTAYLGQLLAQYGGSAPLAIAAYNAGPGRVGEWLGGNGDPRAPGTDMIDWIELIPFGETRNYVQRVIENQTIYRAQLGPGQPGSATAGPQSVRPG